MTILLLRFEQNCTQFSFIFHLDLYFRGYKRFFRRTALETSDFLKDDCLKINCTVGVVVSTMDYSKPHSIHVPESDIGYHFGTLLDNQEGVDVICNVAGEKFHAHQLVLAARSSFFRSELFEHESDEEKNEVDTSNEIKEIVIDDMEPKVFKVYFYFFTDHNLFYFTVHKLG